MSERNNTPKAVPNALNSQRILAQWRIFLLSVESNLERYFSILIFYVTGLAKSHATFSSSYQGIKPIITNRIYYANKQHSRRRWHPVLVLRVM